MHVDKEGDEKHNEKLERKISFNLKATENYLINRQLQKRNKR